MTKLWCALVIKDRLEGNNSNIPDVKICWAESFDEAASVIRNANWPQAYWVQGKSVCRIIKLFEVFSEGFYNLHDSSELMELLHREMLRHLPVEQQDGPTPVPVRKRRIPEPATPPAALSKPSLGVSRIRPTKTSPVSPEPEPAKRRRRKAG